MIRNDLLIELDLKSMKFVERRIAGVHHGKAATIYHEDGLIAYVNEHDMSIMLYFPDKEEGSSE